MLINTKEFQKSCKTILLAVNNTAANLELIAANNNLRLTVTDNEYYVSVAFPISGSEEFKAVVEAKSFLDLIAGLSAETFELIINNNTVVIKSVTSKYTVPMIYKNDVLATLPVISIVNKTVEMNISNSILSSILNINSRELAKNKNLIDVKELQKLYYITQDGCFTFTTGATLNAFTLEKPVQLLLTDKIVKLFRLFDSDVHFSMGHDQTASGELQSKVVFETANTYLAAIINCKNDFLTTIQGPCTATKKFISDTYEYNFVISTNELSAAISRLMSFTKNSLESTNVYNIPATCKVTTDGKFSISDALQNTEVINITNDIAFNSDYTMKLNLADLKLIIDSYKNEYITINCGNKKNIVINHLNISNLIPELV